MLCYASLKENQVSAAIIYQNIILYCHLQESKQSSVGISSWWPRACTTEYGSLWLWEGLVLDFHKKFDIIQQWHHPGYFMGRLFLRIYLFLFYVYVCQYVCMYTTSVSGTPKNQEKELDPWNFSYWWLWALGTNSGSSSRACSVLNHLLSHLCRPCRKTFNYCFTLIVYYGYFKLYLSSGFKIDV